MHLPRFGVLILLVLIVALAVGLFLNSQEQRLGERRLAQLHA